MDIGVNALGRGGRFSAVPPKDQPLEGFIYAIQYGTSAAFDKNKPPTREQLIQLNNLRATLLQKLEDRGKSTLIKFDYGDFHIRLEEYFGATTLLSIGTKTVRLDDKSFDCMHNELASQIIGDACYGFENFTNYALRIALDTKNRDLNLGVRSARLVLSRFITIEGELKFLVADYMLKHNHQFTWDEFYTIGEAIVLEAKLGPPYTFLGWAQRIFTDHHNFRPESRWCAAAYCVVSNASTKELRASALEQMLMKDSPIAAIAVDYIIGFPDQISDKLKYAAADYAFRHPDEFTQNRPIEISEMILKDKMPSLTDTSKAVQIIAAAEKEGYVFLWSSIAYLCSKTKPDSPFFLSAAAYIVNNQKNAPKGFASAVAFMFIDKNKSFFMASMRSEPEFKAFVKQAGRLNDVRNFAKELKELLNANPRSYNVEQRQNNNAKNGKTITKGLTIYSMWVDGDFANAFIHDREEETIAVFLLENLQDLLDPLAVQWNSQGSGSKTKTKA